ncbi:MAG: site-specific DNA-methyltransferase [Terriglobales bacterium]
MRQIASSIKTFGFNVPVLVDGQQRVIAGHGRIEAARLLGLESVPTISLEHLSEAQIRAFMIADNRLTENATWNQSLLAEQFKELSELELDFSLEVTGFEMGEIDVMIEGLDPNADEPAKELPVQADGPEVCQLGDLWLLGSNRVCCGNSLDGASYRELMQDQQAAMVFTDPPYNVVIDGHVGGNGSIQHREFAMASGEMTEEQFTAFLAQACKLLAANSTDGSLHFVCMDWRHITELMLAGKQAYTEFKNLCVWAKDNGGMGSLYRSQHELVFLFKHGKASHCNNVQLGQFGRYRSNVWNYPGVNSFSRSTEEGNLLALHPTVKPVALVADAILDCSRRGDIVLDAFLGSGTTVIAAEKTGRRCFGIELDPRYVDTIIRRWQAFTKLEARHAQSGKSFAELEAEVAHAIQ